MWYEPVGKVIHTKRKTPKQRKEYKKLKAKEKNARKNLSICEKKLEKFNKENQKIIGKYLDLDCKVDEKNEIVYNISQEIDEYEEQFTDYQDQGGSTSEQPMYDEQGFEIEFFDNDTAILESTYAIDGWNNTVIYYGGAPVSREPSRTTSPTNIPNIP